MTDARGSAAGEKTFQQWWRFTYGNTAQWELRASTDLLPQSCSMKNGKYIQYSRIFQTFAWGKISRRISLPHYAVLPYLCSGEQNASESSDFKSAKETAAAFGQPRMLFPF